MRDKILLKQLQCLPLSAKVLMSQQRIREWYNYWNGNVYISFSGGKDSTVLAHLVHDMYPEVPMVFANTGLEYPEIQKFAHDMGAEFIRPKMSFSEVISNYGYPIISKEVAEAIYFARRIVPSDGGGYNGNRDSRESRFKEDEWTKEGRVGGQQEQRTYTPPNRNYTEEQDGGERTSQGTLHYQSEPYRRRADLKGQRSDYPPHPRTTTSNTETDGTRRNKAKSQNQTEMEIRRIRRAREFLMGKNRGR